MGMTDYKFHKLTPTKDASLKVYKDALEYVFSEDDLRNIAITGPYSSGKSSMLETYKAANKEKNFIHISLAHFETATDISNEDELKEKETKEGNEPALEGFDIQDKDEESRFELEGKILNQLIHQVNPEEIPQSHFKIKRGFNNNIVSMGTIMVMAFISLMIFLQNRSKWYNFVDESKTSWVKTVLRPTTTDWFVVIAIIACAAILGYGLYLLVKKQHNKNLFKKLSFQGNEIEVFEKEDSFFDKYLNEVLYLFRHTNADAIVFEDMDRYNSNQIFEKLREINYLLNNGYGEPGDKVFRFFYLLRDDIFTTKDRTKFFDFIVPIVPVIDGANSYDKFIEYFTEGDILGDFDGEFLQEISLYIDDMRLLKNIYNEYRIYYDRIQSTELNRNKLLAMVAYKNLFPRDFSELQIGKGYVYCLFRNKRSFIKAAVDNIDKEIDEIRDRVEDVRKEELKNIDELEALYFQPNWTDLKVDRKAASSFETQGELIRDMKAKPQAITYYHAGYGNTRLDMQPEFDRIHKDSGFIARKEILDAKSDEGKKNLYDEISRLQKRKSGLQSSTLQEIVQVSKSQAEEVFNTSYTNEVKRKYTYTDVKSNLYFPLIKYLIRNGYIDEDYSDYMSYFYGKSVTEKDKIFIRSVTDVAAKPFEYQLKDPEVVSKKVSSRYYSQPEVLNFDLFEYLLKSDNNHLPMVLEQLRDNRRTDFVLEFWELGRESGKLFKNINNAWPAIWKELSVKTTEIRLNRYLIDTFYYSPHSDIEKMNIENIITDYISSCPEFLFVDNPKIYPIIEALNLLDVHFRFIEYEYSNKDLFALVYKADRYMLNEPMIHLILREIYQIPQNEEFSHKNYSLIMTKPEEPLAIYTNKNIASYINFYIDISGGKIIDDEKHAIDILNNENVEFEDKENYICVLETEIQKIQDVKDVELWSLLLTERQVPCSKSNLLNYYFATDCFDNVLDSFINGNDVEIRLSYKEIQEQYGGKVSDFYKNLINNNSLDNSKYKMLLQGFGRYYKNFVFENIDYDKVKILITLGVIPMNEANLDFMRINYASCIVEFIGNDIEEYAQNVINDENFDLDELKQLLSKDSRQVLKLLEFTAEPISIEGEEVSDSVKSHILQNNYFEGDLKYFISCYENESAELKGILLNIFDQEADNIISEDMELPYSAIKEILIDPKRRNKESLFSSQLKYISYDQAIECFNILGMTELLTVFEGKWPLVEVSESNARILKTMENRRWISSFDIEEEKPNYYRVRAKRVKANKDNDLPDHLL